MIEQGIVMLVNADPAVAAMLGAGTGGFFGSLPKDQARPSWSYKVVSSTDLSGSLDAGRQVSQERWQFDFYGDTAAQAILLAQAIDNVLYRFYGVLPDPDATPVQAIFRMDVMDEFDNGARSYRRTMDYQLTFTR